MPVKNQNVVRNYYVLPCCLLLLNLCVELVSYKAKMIDDVWLRTLAIMGMVLFGGSLVGFVVAPAIGVMVGWMQRHSRERFGAAAGRAFANQAWPAEPPSLAGVPLVTRPSPT